MDEPQYQILDISIHALLAESDRRFRASLSAVVTISIHALLAESDNGIQSGAQQATAISIHALLAESDALNLLNPRPAQLFLSTLSLRRATSSDMLECR